MDSPNFVAILAIVAQMARCLKENLGKVHVAPCDTTPTRIGTVDVTKLLGGVSKV